MGYQSKTYSLSDEVVEAIEAAKAGGETPNRYLLRLVRMERVATASGSYLKDIGAEDVKELKYEVDVP